MKLKSSLMATALTSASLANGQTSATAIITVEASHGGAATGLTNTTLTIPLLTQYTNPALDTVSTLYLTGSNGDVEFPSITCYPYRNGNLTGMGGLPFSFGKPSRLSTNTVQVGSIMCNSTDLTAASAGTAPSVTSTLSATTTELTRGSTSDVPNLNGTMVLSLTSSSSSSNGTMTPTSTMRTTVSPTGGAAQETVTSVTVITGGSNGPVTSTMVSAVGATPSSSSMDASTGGGQMGAAGERWQVERWGMAVVAVGMLMSAL